MKEIITKYNKQIKIVGYVLVITLILFTLILSVISHQKEVEEQQREGNRFEIAYSQDESFSKETYPNKDTISIVTDRETDVQYLVIKSKQGVAVTTMRDTNGMVLLRE